MTTRFIQPGRVLDVTNSGAAAIASGAPIVVGTRVGVALNTIAVGATGSVQVCGVFNLPKTSGDNMAQGALVYLTSAGVITTTATDSTLAGVAANAAGAGTTSVNVLLNGVPS